MSKHQLPNSGHTPVNLDEVMAITERLNALLVHESLLLSQMKVKDLAPLQEEKFKLSAKLEAFQRTLAADNQLVASADSATRDKLLDMAGSLAGNIEENLRLTAIAQTVNRRVMQTFVDVLAEQERVHTYSNQGGQASAPGVTISLNLNERA